MLETSVASLDSRHQALVANARIALTRGHLDYALDATARVLKAAPGCIAVRRLQRSAQLRQLHAGNAFFAKVWSGFSIAVFRLSGGKRQPGKEFEAAEAFLAKNPTSLPALKMLARSAHALGLFETAAFALEAVRELQPGNLVNLLALGEAWIAAGKPTDALKVVETILGFNPANAAAQALMRKASIAQTVTKGKWEEAGTSLEKRFDRARTPLMERTRE